MTETSPVETIAVSAVETMNLSDVKGAPGVPLSATVGLHVMVEQIVNPTAQARATVVSWIRVEPGQKWRSRFERERLVIEIEGRGPVAVFDRDKVVAVCAVNVVDDTADRLRQMAEAIRGDHQIPVQVEQPAEAEPAVPRWTDNSITIDEHDRDHLYGVLHGLRETLCLAQMHVPDAKLAYRIDRAVRDIDLLGSTYSLPGQWSEHDRTHEDGEPFPTPASDIPPNQGRALTVLGRHVQTAIDAVTHAMGQAAPDAHAEIAALDQRRQVLDTVVRVLELLGPETTHLSPAAGTDVTQCCGRSPFSLSAERMTNYPGMVTCQG